MPSNYPPGVTGGEYEISGPDTEVESAQWYRECSPEDDEVKTPGMILTYRHDRWFQCENGHVAEDVTAPAEDDRHGY